MLKHRLRKSKSATETDLLAEAAEVGEFGARKRAHFTGHVGDNLGKKRTDERLALVGELHHDEAAVRRIALAADIAGLLQVIHHQSEITAALEELLRELALAERPDVMERFEHAELRDGQSFGQNGMHPDGNGLTGPL